MTIAFWLFHSLNKNKGYVNSWAYKKSREEFCIVNSEAHKRENLSPETREKMSVSQKKRVFTEEQKEAQSLKLSEALSGIPRTQKWRDNISRALKGNEKLIKANKSKKHKPLSKESRAKISASKKGKASWNKGIKSGPMSEANKKKISDAIKESEKACLQLNEVHQMMTGSYWWNNGKECQRSKEQPGPEWKRGRISWKHSM